MRREQNILLVADESSLMRIYNFAKLLKTVSNIESCGDCSSIKLNL